MTIAEEVRRFVAEHVSSMDQLALLLLLRQTAPTCWSAETSARELRIETLAAAGWLEDLRARGLLELTTTEGKPPRFRYEPATPELAAAVAGLSRAYAERKVRVIEMIFSKPRESEARGTRVD